MPALHLTDGESRAIAAYLLREQAATPSHGPNLTKISGVTFEYYEQSFPELPRFDRLTATAIGDFEFVVAASTPWWSTMKEHGRGELLGALADGWLALSETAKANTYLDRMASELPGTAYATNAAARRADPAARVPLTCLGCH